MISGSLKKSGRKLRNAYNQMKIQLIRTFGNTAKAVLRGKSRAMSAYIKKLEISSE
jgi:hypothetical protein